MHVLFVCTGNLCRSPVAERLTTERARTLLGDGSSAVRVGSAGTDAQAGEPMHPDSAAALAALGGDPAGFGSRPLTAAHVRSADLVLTMTRRHRHAAISAAPTTMRRVFTLREAADLLTRIDRPDLTDVPLPERAALLAGRLHAGRRLRPSTEDDDIADPVRRSAAVHTAVAREIAGLVEQLTAVLFVPVPTPPGADTAETDDETGTGITEVTADTEDGAEGAVLLPAPEPEAAPTHHLEPEGTAQPGSRSGGGDAPVSVPARPGTAGTPPAPARPARPGRPRSTRGQGRRR